MAAIRNATSDHSSLNLRKALPPIPIIPTIPIPGIHNRSSPISPVEAAVPTCPQRRDFQRKSTKAKRQTGNALAAAAETTKPTVVRNIHGSVVNRPVRPTSPRIRTGRQLSVRPRDAADIWIMDGDGSVPSPAVPGGHLPTSMDFFQCTS